MADNLSTMSRQRVTNDNIVLPATPDSRMLLASIVHDFNALLTPIVCVLEEMQGRGAGTARQLKKIDGAIYCAFRRQDVGPATARFCESRPVKLAAVDVGLLLERLEDRLQACCRSAIVSISTSPRISPGLSSTSN